MKVLMVDKNEIFTTFIKNMVKDEIYKIKMGQRDEEGYLAFFKQKPKGIITDNKVSKKNMKFFSPIENIIYISSNLNRFKALIKNLKDKKGGVI